VSQLDLYLFGPPRLILGGKTVNIPRRKATALFAYLAVTRRSHSRDALATLLWPEKDQSSARAELRRSLYFINRAVGNEWLETDRESAGLNPDLNTSTGGQFWLDVVEFQGKLTACETHNHPPTETCPDCIPHLEGAVELYTDHFMAGFSLPDSPAYDEWQFFKTEGLRSQLASVLLRLSSHSSSRQDFETAITYTRRWLTLDPFHEPAHQHLMRLYADSGQQAAALRQYQVCCQLLNEELGVAPSEKTQTLYEEIRTRPVYRGVGSYAVSRPRHNLPAQSTPFIGREDELAAIQVLLSNSDCRLITLVGPGGSGKTRLALEAATMQKKRFEHGVFFVSLAPVRSVNTITTTIAEAIGFSFYKGSEPLQQLLNYIRQKIMLLILDNYEHLLEGAPIITEIITGSPNVQVLATSRIKLDLDGEHYFQVGGMSTPDSPLEDITSASQFSAISLFLDCAHRLQPTFTLTEENLSDVVHVCRLVNGMPLGIQLAAHWLEILTPAEIAIEINRNLDFLETSQRDLPPRQRSIRAVFDHSWILLSDQEREVFQQMSVFRGGFTRQAAQTVIGVSLRELIALVNKSLLQRTSSGRYVMHELLRQYAENKLDESPSAGKSVRDRHSSYYAAFVKHCEDELKGPRQQEALLKMDLEINNAETAWEWLVEKVRVEQLEQSVDGLGLYYKKRLRCFDGENLFLQATEKLMAMHSADILRILAKILAWRGSFNLELINIEFAIQLLRQSLEILGEIETSRTDDVRHAKAFAFYQLGYLMGYWSFREEREIMLERSLELYESLEDRWGAAIVLRNMGTDYENSLQRKRESLRILKELGDQLEIAQTLWDTGKTLWTLGQLVEADNAFQEMLSIMQSTDNHYGIGQALFGLGECYSRLGNFKKGHALMMDSLEIFEQLGSIDPRPGLYRNLVLCETKAHLGQYIQAKTLGQMCLSLSQESDFIWNFGFSNFVLGLAALGLDAYSEAHRFLKDSIAALREFNHDENLSWALDVQGYAEIRLGQNLKAKQCLLESLEIAREIGTFFPLIYGLPAVALLLAQNGEVIKAVELYALASRYGFVANSQWFEDVAGKHISAMAASLPSAVVEAAQSRGRALDIWDTAAKLLDELEKMGWSSSETLV
jgi:predicted ATPase/DNA-binding SARP family transcriptional activator